MSIKFNVYDFFSYTVPGSILIIIIFYFLQLANVLFIDITSIDFSLVQLILFVGVSYVVGFLTDPIAHKIWLPLFRPKHIHQLVLNEFKEKHNDLNIKFSANDWPIIQAYIAKENKDMFATIQRFNAMQIMLRSISLGLAVFVLIQAVFLFYSYTIWQLILVLVGSLFSLVAINQSVMFSKWFYASTYEAFVAQSLEPRKLVKTKKRETVASK